MVRYGRNTKDVGAGVAPPSLINTKKKGDERELEGSKKPPATGSTSWIAGCDQLINVLRRLLVFPDLIR